MKEERKHIAVFGLGHAGLPLSLRYSTKGFTVYGIDISSNLVTQLKQGVTDLTESYNGKSIKHILQEEVLAGRFIPSETPEEAFKNCDKYIITVGIPANGDQLSFDDLKSACKTVSSGLQRGDTVIIRSTVVPGTTKEKLIPILEESGLKAGIDFYLCYSPERFSVENAFDEFENLEVIISGVNEESVGKGKEVLKMVYKFEPRAVSSIVLAETAKVAENIHWDMNNAMVHQFSDFCRKLGISVFELVDAVNTDPRVHLVKPGPGVSGYYVPNALYYFKPKATEIGADISLFESSRQLNSAVPKRISAEIHAYFKNYRIIPSDLKIAVLGLASNDHCCDNVQSPVIDIVNELLNHGYEVKAYDPYITEDYPFKAGCSKDCLEKSHALFIGAVHSGIDYNDFIYYKSLMHEGSIIFDTLDVINKSEAEKHGFTVFKVL